tara:strand:- start:1296 stop:2510 length:1215 start_codon:yes stop_codon:yes gene_type:complete
MPSEDKFMGGLVSSPGENFSERIRYSEFIEEKKASLGVEFLDTLRKSRLYGFVDTDFYMVEPNPELVTFGDYAGQIVGLNYVVSCFNKFRDYYLKAVSQGGLALPEALGALVVKKSFEEMTEKYTNFQNLLAQVMIEPFISGRHAGPLMSFESFVENLNQVIFDEDKKHYKITKSGYILSRYASAYQTGLYVDFAPHLDPAVDYVKVELVSDPNFKCYGQIANEYGFLVDQNCPWRLVLDLNSARVREDILNSNNRRPFHEFYSEEYLIKVGLDDYWRLKAFYKKMYLKYTQAKGVSGVLRSFADRFPEEKWIESYLLNRMREIGEFLNVDYYSSTEAPTPSRKKFKKILTEALEKYTILRHQGLPQLTHNSGVILFIENTCAKLLKERIRKANSDPTDARHQR